MWLCCVWHRAGSLADGSGGKYCNPTARLTYTRAEGTFSEWRRSRLASGEACPFRTSARWPKNYCREQGHQWPLPMISLATLPAPACPPPVTGSLAACCAEVESRTRVDPRNGRPMPEQTNVKAACLAYKKPDAGGEAAKAPAPAPAATGKACYGLETDKDVSDNDVGWSGRPGGGGQNLAAALRSLLCVSFWCVLKPSRCSSCCLYARSTSCWASGPPTVDVSRVSDPTSC